MKFATIPVLDDHGWSDDGQQSVVTVDPAKVRTFTSSLLDPSRNTGRGEYTVDVNNAGTVDGLGANVSGILTGKGYQAERCRAHPPTNAIRRSMRRPRQCGALLLAKDLGGLPVKVDASLGDHELRADLTNTYGEWARCPTSATPPPPPPPTQPVPTTRSPPVPTARPV